MTKNKHDHKASNKLKSLIFGIMLLLPFLFLLPTGIYYALNQTATQSETITQEPTYYQSNEINTIDDLVVGNIYELNYTSGSITLPNNILQVEQFIVLEGSYTGDGYQGTTSITTPYIQFSSNNYIYTYETVNNVINTKYYDRLKCVFVFKQTNNSTLPISLINQTDYELISGYLPITTTNSVSTSVINAWNDTWSNPLFSWADTSPFNNAINGFTNVFNIQVENHINTMLAYEFTIVAIYIVFDIVIELFTYLTHLIPRSD